MFRKILITSIAAVGLVSATMQASAHSVMSNNHHHNAPAPRPTYNINVNINLILTLINNGVRNNSLSHNEERLCRQDYKRISNLRTNYSRGGIQHHEHRQLESHIRNAQKRVRDYSRNGERRVVKQHRPVVKHIHRPAVRWVQPQRKHHRKRGHRSHRGSRMNRHQRDQHRGNRQGITVRNRHGAIRFNKHGVRIRINH